MRRYFISDYRDREGWPDKKILEKETWWMPKEERMRVRKKLEKFQQISDKIQLGQNLDKDEQEYIDNNFQGAVDTFLNFAADLERTYWDNLCRMAPHDLTAFHEYMRPSEPPALHHYLIAEKLEKLERGEIQTLLLHMFPGSAKSSYASRSFIMWYFGRNPDNIVLSLGFSEDFVKTEFSKPIREAISSPTYAEIFEGVEISPHTKAASGWNLNEPHKGVYRCRGVNTTTAGLRYDLACLDDVHGGSKTALNAKEREKTINMILTDIFPRARNKNSLNLLIGTPWATDDIFGVVTELLEEPNSTFGKYEILRISCEGGPDNPVEKDPNKFVWEEYYGRNHFLNKKKTLAPHVWSANYLCKPVNVDGGLVRDQDFKRYTTLPDPKKVEISTVMSIDTAEKPNLSSNRSSIQIFQIDEEQGISYMVDAWVGHASMLAIMETMKAMQEKWDVDTILIEEANAGSQIVANYADEFPGLVPITPQSKKDKIFEFETYGLPMIKDGLVRFPEEPTLWFSDWAAEILQFPEGRYDDQVDAFSQFAKTRMIYEARGSVPAVF